jgi:SAM-dependent methyltransferase
MNKEYKYSEVITRFYDVVYDRILSKDGMNFYLGEISNTKGPVLEAGVGTGRIFVPALDNGADIYGIDQSELMLSGLRAKINEKEHHRVCLNDIRDFSLGKKFDLVISPFRVFQHLLSSDDQLRALNCIYEHLNESGRLIFDVFNPDLNRINKDADDVPEFDGEYEPGKRLQRHTSIRYDHIKQILNLTFKFTWDENGKKKQEEFFTPLRYYFRYEIENLIGRTKFRLEKIYGDFKKSELTNQSKEFIVVCKKK